MSLYLQHGARYIYETDDDNILLDDLRGFHIDAAVSRGLMPATDNLTFNPYPHFGQATLWPRGYPLERVGHDTAYDYQIRDVPQASIRQAVANGDPDVDAIFRLTRRHHSDDGKVMFDAAAPRVVIPRGTFVPFNSQDTLFTQEVLWALVLPATLSDRACDIYRSYWAQALLWLVDGHLGFYPPNVLHVRNVHNFLKDMAQETDMYQDMGRLVKFLTNWKCNEPSLFRCMTRLAEDMASNQFWLKRDADVISAWVADLTNLGYVPPGLRQSIEYSEGLPVTYFPHEQNTSFSHIDGMSHVSADLADQQSRLDLLQSVCKAKVYNTVSTEHPIKTQQLLIVTMRATTATIPLIDAYYKSCYTHILYCGTVMPDKSLLHKWKVSYLKVSRTVDAVLCVKAASEMGYNVDGFVHVSDEVLLLPGNKLHSDGLSTMLVATNTAYMSQMCKVNAAKCMDLTESVVGDLSAKLDTLDIGGGTKLKLKECFKTLVPQGTGKVSYVEDMAFYVPEGLVHLFQTLGGVFTGQYSYVTVLLLGCLETQPVYLASARQVTAAHQVDFLFPFQFSAIDRDSGMQNLYCKSLHSC